MFFEEQLAESIRRRNTGAPAKSQVAKSRRGDLQHGDVQRPRRKKRHMVLERDGFRCVKCCNATLEELTMDHIWPRCRKGCYCTANLQVLCVDCNQAKGSRFEIVGGVIQGHPRGHCPRT